MSWEFIELNYDIDYISDCFISTTSILLLFIMSSLFWVLVNYELPWLNPIPDNYKGKSLDPHEYSIFVSIPPSLFFSSYNLMNFFLSNAWALLLENLAMCLKIEGVTILRFSIFSSSLQKKIKKLLKGKIPIAAVNHCQNLFLFSGFFWKLL